MNSIAKRRERYFKRSTDLAQIDTPTLLSHLRWRKGSRVWGGNQVLELAGTRFFVKKLPITDREYDNAFSTRNLYQLPTYYNYGVGSVGFSPFREISAHIKTTNWVLDGAIENFPLMYHYRIVPSSYKDPGMNRKNLDGYVKYWNGSKRVGRYIQERSKARHEIYVFLEFVPRSLSRWLGNHLSETPSVIDQMKRIHAFLRDRGIVHFDSHHSNIVTDGHRVYLTDFGLVSDKTLDLNDAERALLKDNRFYDCGEFLAGLGRYVIQRYENLTGPVRAQLERHYGMEGETPRNQRDIIRNNLKEICERGWLDLPPAPRGFLGHSVDLQ